MVDFVTLRHCGITHGHQGPSRLRAINQPVVFLKTQRYLFPLPKAELLQKGSQGFPRPEVEDRLLNLGGQDGEKERYQSEVLT